MKRLISLALTAALCAALTVPALAAEAPAFSDVPGDAWYADAADWCHKNGILNGYDDGLFHPAAAVSRAMAVTVLFRLAGSVGDLPEEPSFPDVPGDAWYARAVEWAVQQDITSGCDDGLFHPADPVTREQLAAFLWRYTGQPLAALPADYPDVDDVSPYARDAAAWTQEQEIINGYEDGSFAPKKTASRAELAVILTRFAQGTGLEADCAPSGIILAADGSLLVTDTNNKVIWRVASDAREIYAGGASAVGLYGEPLGGYHDSSLEESFFKEPWAIVPFMDGWAVSDAANDAVRLVRTTSVGTLNGTTKESLSVTKLGVSFNRPTGLAADEEGNLYVSDTLNNAVRKVTPKGEVSTVAKDLQDPTGLCWHNGALYIAETSGNRILKLEGTKLTVVAGSGEADFLDGEAAQAAFNAPQGVVVDEDGTIYVSDTVNGAIRRIRDGQVDTLLRSTADPDQFVPISPRGLAIREGRLYVCDNFARKLLVLRLGK